MSLLPLTIISPIIGFIILSFWGRNLKENTAATIGITSVGIAALATLFVGFNYMSHTPDAHMTLHLWTWMQAGSFNIPFSLTLDGLSLTMLSVVTGVGFLIHIYASYYMRGEEGYSRFFAYTNLFIASMVILVLAENMVVLYLGWEGVGLCSYLLIGFYFKNPANGAAAMKAFIVTRIGDVLLAFGLFMLYQAAGTLNMQELATIIPAKLEAGSPEITWATLMLLGGAVGKSAQLPLQTWLADAMAGPTPVSALIHAATMVTAGVYLIARNHVLFLHAPEVLHFVGIVGAVTLLLAGFAALVQTDIKRVLAYSTMSQIGYMFLALGVQAWDAAIFHLMTHAFFKALLFLASGSVILACHHEQNMLKMGGLRKKIPLVYLCFLVGGGALAALPLITAGFFSKDEILIGAHANGDNGLMIAGLFGALLTSIYTFRMIILTFHGEEKTEAHGLNGITHHLPLIILLILSTTVGAFIPQPLNHVLPDLKDANDAHLTIAIISSIVAIVGVLIAFALYQGERKLVNIIKASTFGKILSNLWFHAWGFDCLYHWLFVKPFLFIAKILHKDPLDKTVDSTTWLVRLANKGLTLTANGQTRWYTATMLIGAIVLLILLFWL
ncbi:NADH-quinone oxidoreductase subunit L [Thorsellia kenyensis]|uniref:NADH-quinone oxidoreductase subunit L n=1 Tax=Thorsellia kenyensis TaxID=1549888 RepID=A0ABV6C6V9_9GAMM